MRLSGSNRIEIAAARERCRAVLLDFEGYADWFPGVRESTAVVTAEAAPAGRLVFSAGIDLVPDIPCTLRYDLSVTNRLTPVVTDGALRIGGPGWQLEALAEQRTLIRYEVELELELSVPGGRLAERVLSGPARRYLIEQPAEQLRRHVERAVDKGMR